MIGVGLIVLLGQFRDVNLFRALILPDLSNAFVTWAGILFAFALLLGLLNLLSVHVGRIRQRAEGWQYSAVLIATVVIVLAAGLNGVTSRSLQWIFRNVQVPLQATFLSLLVFFIASATVRSFRVRSIGTVLMMLTAVVVLLGQMPFGDNISTDLVDLQQWIRSVPAVAGQRGILLGVALGTIATGLRILLGVERRRFFH
jgi:hypothetical protein